MAASKLVDQLSRDLLECGICLDRFKKPKALTCMHCFCEECLERYCKGQTQVLCPICKQPTNVPKKGVRAFPAHFMVNTLQDTINKAGNEIIDDPSCSNCPDKKASVRCFDCNELFCDDCHESHNSWKSMKAHTVVSMKDLRSGKVVPPLRTTEEQICKDHDGERKKFYCETCEIPICRDCIILDHRQHKYISLKEACKNQVTKLKCLARKCESSKKKYADAITTANNTEKSLEDTSENISKKLQMIKSEYQQKLDTIFKQHEARAAAMVAKRAKKLLAIKENLQTELAKVEIACEVVSKVTETGSDYDIISIFPELVENLEEVAMIAESDTVNDKLGIIEVTTIGKVEIPDVVFINVVTGETCKESEQFVKGETWKESGQLSTGSCFCPCGIAINQDGKVAVTNALGGSAKLLSVDGSLKHTFKGPLNSHMWDIAVTQDNKYILPGDKELLFYDEQGYRLKYPKAATYDMNNKLSDIQSIAADSMGRIVVGLKGNTISIHQADKLISKFATPATPMTSGLDVTSAGYIAATFNNKSLQVMDYSGNNVKVVKPPHGVKQWEPSSVCCSKQGDIFVENDNHPKSVYRYTADGDQYLGCVITGLVAPLGIDISEDGQKIFVAEFGQDIVKIFQRC